MSRAIYANLQLWDPRGQMKIEPGLLYGGQSMFFVLAADDLESGLIRLLDAVAQKGLGVVRLLYAGEASNFSDDHFPFEVDMQTMADSAEIAFPLPLSPQWNEMLTVIDDNLGEFWLGKGETQAVMDTIQEQLEFLFSD